MENNHEISSIFDRIELTRLAIQLLSDLGLERSAKCVEDESGTYLTDSTIEQFFELLEQGKWQESIAALRRMQVKVNLDV